LISVLWKPIDQFPGSCGAKRSKVHNYDWKLLPLDGDHAQPQLFVPLVECDSGERKHANCHFSSAAQKTKPRWVVKLETRMERLFCVAWCCLLQASSAARFRAASVPF